MASACVNNIGLSTENFLDCPAAYPSYGWLSPRISLSRDDSGTVAASAAGGAKSPPALDTTKEKASRALELSDLEEESLKEAGEFEFRLHDPVTMLPADELFSDGKLVPLQLFSVRPTTEMALVPPAEGIATQEEGGKSCGRNEVLSASTTEPFLFSPKAPRCSNRWRNFLGLRKLYQNTNSSSKQQGSNKSVMYFLHRSSKSTPSSSSADVVPLLKDSDCESSLSISSRLSVSSSSSGLDHDDLFRPSLNSDKPNPSQAHTYLSRSSSGPNHNVNPNPPKVRMVKPRTVSDRPSSGSRVGRSLMREPRPDPATITRGVSVDSPRMNSSGKIVFQSLERSSSSPSSFHGGGPRYKYRGTERSYSANVRITPVLNVPVCSLRVSSKSGVFGLFSSQLHKKEGNGGRKSQKPSPSD